MTSEDVLKYKSDMVLALDMLSYVVIFGYQSFDCVIRFFQQISNKPFITSFHNDYKMFLENEYGNNVNDFDLEWYIKSLKQCFKDVTILRHGGKDDHSILLCEK